MKKYYRIYFDENRIAAEIKDYDEALAKFNRLCEKNPNSTFLFMEITESEKLIGHN